MRCSLWRWVLAADVGWTRHAAAQARVTHAWDEFKTCRNRFSLAALDAALLNPAEESRLEVLEMENELRECETRYLLNIMPDIAKNCRPCKCTDDPRPCELRDDGE
jgi:hypothetical protein